MRTKNESQLLVTPYTYTGLTTRSRSGDDERALINPHQITTGQRVRGGSPCGQTQQQSCGSPSNEQSNYYESYSINGEAESKECYENNSPTAPNLHSRAKHISEFNYNEKHEYKHECNYEPADDPELTAFLFDAYEQENDFANFDNVNLYEVKNVDPSQQVAELHGVTTMERDILDDLLNDTEEADSLQNANQLIASSSLTDANKLDDDVDDWIMSLHLEEDVANIVVIPSPVTATVPAAVHIPPPVSAAAPVNYRKRRYSETVNPVPRLSHEVPKNGSTTLDQVPSLINHGFHSFQSAVIGQENKKLESFQERNLFITSSNKTGILYFIIEKKEGEYPCSLEMWGGHAAAHFKPIYTNDNSPLAMLYRVIPLHDHESSLTYSQNLLGKNEDHLWREIPTLSNIYSGNHEDDASSFRPLAADYIALPAKRGRFLVAIQPVKGVLNSKSIDSRGYQHTALRFVQKNGEETIYKGQAYKCASKDPHFVKVKKEKSS